MVASLLLLLATLPLHRAPVAKDDLLLSPVRVEASREASGDAFEPIRIGGRPGTIAWRRARLTFELPPEPEAGAWMLALGGSELQANASLAGEALGRATDAYEGDLRLCTGPRFTLPSERLAAGPVTFLLEFEGEAGGRGLEQGPAWLASPLPAARAFAAAQVGGLVAATANFATTGLLSQDHVPFERVLFKWSADGDAPRLAATLDCSLVDSERGGDVPLRTLATRRSMAVFPTSSVNVEDKRFSALKTQFLLRAPHLTSPLRLSDAKAVVIDVSQTALREAFRFTWNLRLLPNRGGPLRFTKGEGFVLLANEQVGLLASSGRPIGAPDAPCGIAIELASSEAKGSLASLAAGKVVAGLVGFEPEGPDPSQAESLAELAHSLIALHEPEREAGADLASMLAVEPNVGGAQAGQASRKAALATLFDMRRRNGRFAYAPGGRSATPEAFWGDTFTLLHHPNHERVALEKLLSGQQDDGSLPGDLAADASDVERAACAAYAVLRATRWFRWACDGDRFTALVPALEKALAFADAIDLSPGPAVPGGLTPLHAALARAAAHRQLAESLDEIALLPERSAVHADLATRQLEGLLGSVESGGRLAADGFPELVQADPREAAVALALELCDDAASQAIAAQVAIGKRELDVTDWRDALVARGLLASGRSKALGKSLATLENGWRNFELPTGAGLASWHGVIVFGWIGARRENLGTLEVRPRIDEGQFLRSPIRLPEGAIRFNVGLTDAQFERQVIVINDGDLDVLVRLGIPNGSIAGQRVKRGDLIHAFHEHVLMRKETWRTRIR